MTRLQTGARRRGVPTGELLLALVFFVTLDSALAFAATQVWPDATQECARRLGRYRFLNDWRRE